MNINWPKVLLSWYDGNKRDLPWRESKNPYHIWVSEVMSQQTRIEAMRPYYETWMRLFPSIKDLAEASEDDVVKAWQGLGYYSRARNLRLGAQEILAKQGGQIPTDRKTLESIQGIGPYTAGAILSIAYNLPEVAVDGNVLRVYARLYDCHEDVLKAKGKKLITSKVEETLPSARPGDFNQALMDFGTAICIPKAPRCHLCPLQKDCLAYEKGTMNDLPIRTKKKAIPITVVITLLIEQNGYYLLHKRPDKGLLRSMWEFPSVYIDDYDIVKVAREGESAIKDKKLSIGQTSSGLSKRAFLARLKLIRNEGFDGKQSLVAEEVSLYGKSNKREDKKYIKGEPLLLAQHLAYKQLQETCKVMGLELLDFINEEKRLRHVFSHREWQMHVYTVKSRWRDGTAIENILSKQQKGPFSLAIENPIKGAKEVDANLDIGKNEWRWVAPKDFASLPWAGPHGKLTILCNK